VRRRPRRCVCQYGRVVPLRAYPEDVQPFDAWRGESRRKNHGSHSQAVRIAKDDAPNCTDLEAVVIELGHDVVGLASNLELLGGRVRPSTSPCWTSTHAEGLILCRSPESSLL